MNLTLNPSNLRYYWLRFSKNRRARQIAGLLAWAFVAALYLYGAEQQATQVNNIGPYFDQGLYAHNSRLMVESNYTYWGDRNQMPVYHLMQSFFYRPWLSEETFLERGKYVNIGLSLLLLWAIFLIFRAHFPPLHAVHLIFVTAFTVFIFKAGYFQAELLYYFFSFGSYVLMCALLVRPTPKRALLGGVVTGLAYLTKASVLPGVFLFLLLAAVKVLLDLWRNRSREQSAARTSTLAMFLFAALFLIIISPYAWQTRQLYGSYFYNVNSTYFMWYDSWPAVKEGPVYHSYSAILSGEQPPGRPVLPVEETPGPAKYWREHSLDQIQFRLVRGFRALLWVAITSYGYFKYMFIYLVFALTTVLFHRSQAISLLRHYWLPLLFTLAYFAAYLFLYAWYTPIDVGNRFTLSLFLPYLFLVSLAISKQYDGQPSLAVGGMTLKLLDVVLFPLLVVDVYLILTSRIVTMYGGI
jgi:hypothetical protein